MDDIFADRASHRASRIHRGDSIALQEHPIDVHLSPTQTALLAPVLALFTGPLRAVEDWCSFAEDQLFRNVYSRAARAQLSWPLSMAAPQLARQRVLARLQANGWDATKVRDEAVQAYRSLAALTGPLHLLQPAAGELESEDTRVPGTPGSPEILFSPGMQLGETLPLGRRRTLAPVVLSELQMRMAAAATPLRPPRPTASDVGAGQPDPTTPARDGASASAAPAASSLAAPSASGPFLLGAALPSSADVALYAHLRHICVRHGPPSEWISAHTPGLVAYFHMMDGLAQGAREGMASAASAPGATQSGAPTPGQQKMSANEFELLAAAIDRRCALLHHYEQPATDVAPGPAADLASDPAGAGKWGYDPALVKSASVDALTSGRGPAKLLQDAAVTVGIFATALILARAVARGGAI